MIKVTTASDQWVIFDAVRDEYNVTEKLLFPNASASEATEAGAKADFLSNGFKLRGSGAGIGQTNTSSANYIFMAFAEHPFKLSLAR
jgi:hypothetical protein